MVRTETSRVARMSRALLNLEKARDITDEVTELDAAALIRSTSEHYRVLVEHSGNKLSVDIPDGLPHVTGNADGLSQLIVNLISNANSHTRGGTIRVKAERLPGAISVTVSDTGAGIEAEILPGVFKRKPFRTTDGEVSGVGLSICREIVERHGGDIRMESAPGAGTSVTFRIPSAQRGSEHER